jgi:uncharacterized protein (TIGR00297 family)
VSWRRAALALSLASAVSATAYWRRSLTLDGALAATGMGAIVFGRGGAAGAAALLAFFVSSSALSRLGEAEPHGAIAEKGARRDAWQVLANGGAATACLALGSRGGFVAGLAAAGADTWATELGMRSSATPRSISTWQPVERGVSGGVTVQGLLASVAGAGVVGMAWSVPARQPRALAVALLAGTCGSLLDSVLGATVQARYRCQECGAWTERRSHHDRPTTLVHGFDQVDNDRVNALATLAAAALGGWIGLGRLSRR